MSAAGVRGPRGGMPPVHLRPLVTPRALAPAASLMIQSTRFAAHPTGGRAAAAASCEGGIERVCSRWEGWQAAPGRPHRHSFSASASPPRYQAGLIARQLGSAAGIRMHGQAAKEGQGSCNSNDEAGKQASSYSVLCPGFIASGATMAAAGRGQRELATPNARAGWCCRQRWCSAPRDVKFALPSNSCRKQVLLQRAQQHGARAEGMCA